MTQEDKSLLLKDLCARLPYGVMLNIDYYDLQGDGKLKNRDVILSYGNIGYCSDNTNWVSVKPYLRPMSSMTDEEFQSVCKIDKKRMMYSSRHLTWHLDGEVIDYFNSRMLDWRNLIPRGLALPAPPDMYKID